MGKEKWEPKEEAAAMERIVDNIKAEAERQASEWIGDAQGMVE